MTFEDGAHGRYADWTVLPAKKGEQQAKDEHVFLPEDDGVTDAYTALKEMIELRRRLWPNEPDTRLHRCSFCLTIGRTT